VNKLSFNLAYDNDLDNYADKRWTPWP